MDPAIALGLGMIALAFGMAAVARYRLQRQAGGGAMPLPVVLSDPAVRRVKLPALLLPNGRLQLGDPAFADGLTVMLPPGRWAASLHIRTAGDDERIAALMLARAPAADLQWRQRRGDGGRAVMIGTDSATLAVAAAGQAWPDAEALAAAMQANWQDTRGWAVLNGVIAFSSGMGDGLYALWEGLDVTGTVHGLAVDLDVRWR